MAGYIFLLFGFLLVASSVAAVTFRNPVYAVFSLMAAFIAGASLFLFLRAEFLAMVMVVVYVGAVVTLFLFVVMMLNVAVASFTRRSWSILPMAAAMATVLIVSLNKLMLGWHQAGRIGGEELNINTLAAALYTDYLLAFQMSGLIFIVAMVAPILLNLRRRQVKSQDPAAQMRKKNVRLVKVKSGRGA